MPIERTLAFSLLSDREGYLAAAPLHPQAITEDRDLDKPSCARRILKHGETPEKPAAEAAKANTGKGAWADFVSAAKAGEVSRGGRGAA